MPSPKGHGRRRNVAITEKNRKGRLVEKAQSFHSGHSSDGKLSLLPRPRTVPDLRPSGGQALERSSSNGVVRQPAKLTKLLLKVTIQRSLGAVQVLMSPESTVEDLIAAALRQYSKESRRPVLSPIEPSGFDLHYSQFSLESLNREEKLMELGSRNFFLCPKPCDTMSSGPSSCSKQAERANGPHLDGICKLHHLIRHLRWHVSPSGHEDWVVCEMYRSINFLLLLQVYNLKMNWWPWF